MSVIIRLQNLPWSANAMDIRQFFKGLSIPEGGVHIVGGEMGDAFIAFSTDEDARQAMMHDRESIKEVQVRLLLSSRAEMQKVIEKARLNSLSVYQQLAAAAAVPTAAIRATPMAATFNAIVNKPVITTPPTVAAATVASMLPSNPTPSFLAYQQQAGITLTGSPISASDFDSNSKNSTKKDEPPSSKRSERSHERERERRRSTSRDRRDYRRRSPSRDRRDYRRHHDGSRSRSRERDRERGPNRSRADGWKERDRSRRSSSRNSRDREREREREHSRGRSYNRNTHRSESKERDPRLRRAAAKAADAAAATTSREDNNNVETSAQPKTTAWSAQATNSYLTNPYQTTPSNAYSTAVNKEQSPRIAVTASTVNRMVATTTMTPVAIAANSPEIVIPAFQNYTTSMITNNYSLNMYGGNSNSNSSNDAAALKHFVLQNPYTTAQQQQPALSPALADNKNSNLPQLAKVLAPVVSPVLTPVVADVAPMTTFPPVDQEPIAFAKTNPYEQMYPNLFAQAAAQQMPRSNATAAQRMNSPGGRVNDTNVPYPESSSIKISDMCTNTNYSDLRKFFAGLFIPHNGIKMVNDKNGMRTGVAYIQFSRSNSVPKALTRNRTMLKSNVIQIEAVPDEEFNAAEDGYRGHGRFDRSNFNDNDKERNRFDGGNNMGGNDQQRGLSRKPNDEPFSVLYLEELPPLTTEQDLMKMFSSYSLYDILLLPSAENRREYVAHVKFSLPDDARAALEDKSKHMIGYRKVRVYAGKDEEMEKAKEKLRLANEQLLKEEQEEAIRAAAEAEELEHQNMAGRRPEVETDDETIDMKTEDMSMSPQPSMEGSGDAHDLRGGRDPRMIPSLLEIAPVGLENAQSNAGPNIGPADPRLRGRSRPSRFDANETNDSNAPPTSNNNMMMPSMNATNGMDVATRNPANPFGAGGGSHAMNGGNNINTSNGINIGGGNNFNSNDMPMQMPFQRNMPMPIENNFLFLFNCPYRTCQLDIADLFRSENMLVKHVEMLNNVRGQPSGEFIVEVFNARDAETALNEFNNIQFRGRSLRVRSITPQGIADRLRKPFMNCIPGGGMGPAFNNFNNMNNGPGSDNGMMMRGNMRGSDFNSDMSDNLRGTGGGSSSSVNDSPIRRDRLGPNGPGGGNMQRGGMGVGNRNNKFNNDNEDDGGVYNNDDCINENAAKRGALDNDIFSDNKGGKDTGIGNDSGNGGGGGNIPEKFTRSKCVVALENVPYKADLKDILRFFGGFNLRPDDIVRRYNDDGSATSDARVAFSSPGEAQAAYSKCNRKQIFNRTIYLSIL